MLKEKIWANFQRIIELITQKIFTKLSKIWVWDPGYESGIQDPEKIYPGSLDVKGTGSQIRILNIAYLKKLLYLKSLFSFQDKKLRGCIGTFSEMQLHSGNQASIISLLFIILFSVDYGYRYNVAYGTVSIRFSSVDLDPSFCKQCSYVFYTAAFSEF
jgi:hypothetical protein